MARIRSIKPAFFRHEKLQEMGAEAMLVFAGLWTQCDSKGRFEWKPRHLKLDILPFMDFDMSTTLDRLFEAGLIDKYKVGKEEYGEIVSFLKHQRISGKELVAGEFYPENPGKQSRSNGEATGKRPVAQEEEKEIGIGRGKDTRANPKSSFALFKPTVESLFGKPTSIATEQRQFRLVGELAALGATPEELQTRTEHYRLCWPDVACTLQAVLNHWTTIPTLKPKGTTNGANRKPTRSERLDADAESLLRDLGGFEAPGSDRGPATTNGDVTGSRNPLHGEAIALGGGRSSVVEGNTHGGHTHGRG